MNRMPLSSAAFFGDSVHQRWLLLVLMLAVAEEGRTTKLSKISPELTMLRSWVSLTRAHWVQGARHYPTIFHA